MLSTIFSLFFKTPPSNNLNSNFSKLELTHLLHIMRFLTPNEYENTTQEKEKKERDLTQFLLLPIRVLMRGLVRQYLEEVMDPHHIRFPLVLAQYYKNCGLTPNEYENTTREKEKKEVNLTQFLLSLRLVKKSWKEVIDSHEILFPLVLTQYYKKLLSTIQSTPSYEAAQLIEQQKLPFFLNKQYRSDDDEEIGKQSISIPSLREIMRFLGLNKGNRRVITSAEFAEKLLQALQNPATNIALHTALNAALNQKHTEVAISELNKMQADAALQLQKFRSLPHRIGNFFLSLFRGAVHPVSLY